MVRQQNRRRFLRASGLAAAIGIAGCSGSPSEDSTRTETGTAQTESAETSTETAQTESAETATETAQTESTEASTETGMDPVSFDFDDSRDALSSAGWLLGQSIELSGSHLRGTRRENSPNDYAMYPSPSVGTWSFGGVANDEQFYGIQFILSSADTESTDIDEDALGTAEGYSLLIRQERYGGLRFRKVTHDEETEEVEWTSLHEEEFESSGTPNDYAITMLESNRFRISMNDAELAVVTDDTVDINSLVVRFDAADQRVDSIAYSR